MDFDPGTEEVQLVATDSGDLYVAKYDASGNLVWVTQAGTSDQSPQGLGIAVDGSGNSYVTGYSTGTVDLDPGTEVTILAGPAPRNHFFVAKYDASGNLDWVTSARPSAGIEESNGMAVMSSLPPDGAEGKGIVVDGSGNSYVTGGFRGTVDFDPGTGTEELVSTDRDHFVAKYDAFGDLVWARNAGSSDRDEEGRGIAIDASGNIVVSGAFRGTVDFDPGIGEAIASSPSNGTYFVAVYTPSGDLVGPGVPDLAAADDSGSSSTDNVTNVTTPTFTGTVQAGASVVLLADGSPVGNVTADGNGDWSITAATLSDGVHSVVAQVTERTGPRDSGALSVTIDTTAPETTILSGPDSRSDRDEATFGFGPEEAGIVFTVSLDGGSARTVPDSWTLDDLDDGRHVLQVHATDLAGNVDATPARFSWTVDDPRPDDENPPSEEPGIEVTSPGGDWLGAGSEGGDTIAGSDGDDTIYGWGGDDGLQGEGGDDWLHGNLDDDEIDGGSGDDVVYGGRGEDSLEGGEGGDWLNGNRGDDTVSGGEGRDTLYGGQAQDSLLGGAGDDRAYGNIGRDTLSGGEGRDTLHGGQDGDRLSGGDGDDLLSGDRGDDVLTGDDGGDRFVYATGGGLDHITDFDAGEDQMVIDLDAAGMVNGVAVASVVDLLARLVETADGVFLELGEGQGVLLAGLTRGELSAADFDII